MDASDLPPPRATLSPPPASLFDVLPEALLRFDALGRVVYANAAFERATLLARRSLLGRRLADTEGLAPYAELWDQQLHELLRTEEERWFKFGYDHPLGRRHFDVRLLLERDAAEPFVTALLRDVTYARGVTRASRGADAVADAMLAAVNVGLALLDRNLRYRHVNDFFAELAGIPAERALGRRPDEILDLSGAPELVATLERMRVGTLRSTEQVEFVLPAGGRPWVRQRCTPIYDARGSFDGVFVLAERIDPARLAETSLSALRGALEQAGELVIEVGVDGIIIDANETALQQLGLARAEIGTTPIVQFDRELGAADFGRMLERLRQHGAERRETRYFSRLRPGLTLPVEVIAQRAAHEGRESVLLLARDIGERKRTEAALLESAERFRSLFDDSPVALLLLDENLRVLQANRAAGRLLDCALVDLVGAEVPGLLMGRDLAAADRLRRDLAADALHESDADVRIAQSDGRVVWARLVARRWRAGASRRLLLVLEDYTERKLAALELQAAVAQQRTLLESMAAAVAQVRDGVVVRANAEFSRLFGVGADEVAGMPLARIADGSRAGGADAGPLPEVAPGRPAGAETLLVGADGQPVWCLVQARSVEADDGSAAGGDAIYTFQDITTQRASREALSRSLLELNAVFDSTEVGLLHLSGGRVVRCNAQAAAMFGGGEGPLDRRFADLIERGDDEPAPAWLNEETPSVEARMRGTGGVPFWALVSMRAIDGRQPAAGQIVTVLNIDARKQTEQEVRQMRNYLDLVVESLPVTIAVRSARDGRFVSINRAGEVLLGRPRKQIVGRTWQELFPPPFADELAAIDARALQSGQMVEQPRASSRTADGRQLTVHHRALPLFEGAEAGEAGTRAPRYLLSIIDDLSDAARTEEALQDTEARFRELSEHIDAFVFIADSNLARLIYASPRCEALLGIGAARLQADPRLALECVQAQERPALARRLPFVIGRLARLRRAEMTVPIDHPTRGKRSITVRFTPARTPSGGLRIFGMAEDATEREAVQDQRLASALKRHDLVIHEVRQRLKKNLRGVAALLQQQAFSRPELAGPLVDAAAQIQAIALAHGIQPAGGGVPLVAIVQGVFSDLAGMFGAIVQVEPPAPSVALWRVADREAVPMALAVNELGANAIKHRGKTDQRVVARLTARGERVELRIEQPGRLKPGFDLARVGSNVTGLGLAKSLLPHRGARLRVEQLGPLVITRLELAPPAIRLATRAPAEAPAPAAPVPVAERG